MSFLEFLLKYVSAVMPHYALKYSDASLLIEVQQNIVNLLQYYA
jgi:hypothetical protein